MAKLTIEVYDGEDKGVKGYFAEVKLEGANGKKEGDLIEMIARAFQGLERTFDEDIVDKAYLFSAFI